MVKKSKLKGKPVQGRAAQKKKAQRESSNAAGSFSRSSGWPRSGKGFDDDDDDDAYMKFRGFAQSRHQEDSSRVPSFKLRNQAISFVSAGTTTPIEIPPRRLEDNVCEEQEDNDQGKEKSEFENRPSQTNVAVETEVRASESAMANMKLDGPADDYEPQTLQAPHQTAITPDTSLFVVDTLGDSTLAGHPRVNDKQAARRALSPAPSDSSEEVVVFHGRNRPIVVDDPIPSNSIQTDAVSRPPRQPSPDRSLPAEHTRSGPEQSPGADEEEDLLSALEASLADSAAPLSVDRPSASHPSPDQPSADQARADSISGDQTSADQTSAPPPSGFTAQPSDFRPSGWAAVTSKRDLAADPHATWAPAPAGSWWKNKEPQPQTQPREWGTAEDTISQLQADWNQVVREKRLLKSSGEDPDMIKLDVPKANRRGKRGRKKDNRALRDQGSSADEEMEAALNDYIANMSEQDLPSGGDGEVGAAFGLVDLAGGPSIVVDGRAVGDDELLDERMSMTGEEYGSSEDEDDDVIGEDDESEELGDEKYSGLDSSDLDDELRYTEEQQWQDEADLRQRRIDAMTDEKLARLFAKQQELGIDDDELILEDGLLDDMDGVGDIDAARIGLANLSNLDFGGGPSRRHRNRRGKGEPTFVDASMMADIMEQYGEGGFDIMDFERPSLRSTKKGRKGKLPPELEAISDDDLRDTTAQAWDNDRSKKAKKKAEREELRAQGLLGSKNGTPDLRVKYANGMTMSQVQEELRLFLADDGKVSLAFPPMDKQDRKNLHQMANLFKLKSKSIGGGQTRFPVLTKTSRTWLPSRDDMQSIFAASSRGFLGSRKFVKKATASRPGAGGGFNKAAVGLRNGEVVGAGAAEIGKENFGHRMMEKMGWSKGQALGKEGEGRLIPVEQVMRSGRAGLG